MKSNIMLFEKKSLLSVTGCLLMCLSPFVSAGAMGSQSVESIGKVYVGVFGGGGAIVSTSLSQQGSAFKSDSQGGPLAVNAFGKSSGGNSAWVVGGHVGYEWPARVLSYFNSKWSFSPATELEGYYLGGVTLSGDDINNNTDRLDEHDFFVSYPMQTSVFLINAILNINNSGFSKFHPYVGVGIGSAIVSISGANSTQTSPFEAGINHYNSDSSDTVTAFAAQPKIGVQWNLNQNTSVFAEYRFLYLAATGYTFGSTVYPTHVATSNWDVKIGAQKYNIGTVGVRFGL